MIALYPGNGEGTTCGILSVADETKASFILPMLLVRTEKLPEGDGWLYELKLDGYRSIAFKTDGQVYLRAASVHPLIALLDE